MNYAMIIEMEERDLEEITVFVCMDNRVDKRMMMEMEA